MNKRDAVRPLLSVTTADGGFVLNQKSSICFPNSKHTPVRDVSTFSSLNKHRKLTLVCKPGITWAAGYIMLARSLCLSLSLSLSLSVSLLLSLSLSLSLSRHTLLLFLLNSWDFRCTEPIADKLDACILLQQCQSGFVQLINSAGSYHHLLWGRSMLGFRL